YGRWRNQIEAQSPAGTGQPLPPTAPLRAAPSRDCDEVPGTADQPLPRGASNPQRPQVAQSARKQVQADAAPPHDLHHWPALARKALPPPLSAPPDAPPAPAP